MFLLVWTFIVVSSLLDTRNLQVHSRFFLVETEDGNHHTSDTDYAAKCENIDKKCDKYSDKCHDNLVQARCQKTCRLCPGDGGICFDRDKTQCKEYKEKGHCNDPFVANMCRKTCGICTAECSEKPCGTSCDNGHGVCDGIGHCVDASPNPCVDKQRCTRNIDCSWVPGCKDDPCVCQ